MHSFHRIATIISTRQASDAGPCVSTECVFFFEVFGILPVARVATGEGVAEGGDDPLPHETLTFADGAHLNRR